MCGINILNKINTSIEKLNYHCKKRGPDNTNIHEHTGITFIHNLLSITGNKTIQPFIKNNIICLFNGEIYNYKDIEIYDKDSDYKSDGECIIDCYLTYGLEFPNILDGEFAIILFDFNKNECYSITDPFGTKPLFYSVNNSGDFMFSSYSRCIEENNMEIIEKQKPNTLIKFEISYNNELKRNELIINQEIILWKFDLNQYKTSYNDWEMAFHNSVKKRVCKLIKPLFVSMSSGYDSGSICCELNNMREQYDTFTIQGKEDKTILQNRIYINKKINNVESNMLYLNENLISVEKERNEKECSNFIKIIRKNHPNKQYSVFKDRALNGGGFISKNAIAKKYKVCLSGQGADEILADYGWNGNKKTWHSCFGGLFPSNLKDILNENDNYNSKWESFQGGINESLIMKEEIIYGSYGIETRYPFLDKYLVQEFLWLTPELKNRSFKAPLDYYLTKNNYPFKKNEKIGLNCLY